MPLPSIHLGNPGFFALSSGLRQLAVAACGAPPLQPRVINLDSLLGGRHLIATLFQFGTIWFTMFTLFILFALRTVLRRQWLAVLGFVLIFTTLEVLDDWSRLSGLAMGVSICIAVVPMLLHVLLLLRFGLVALAVGLFIATVPRQFPICLDFSTWYATGSFVGILTVLVVAGFGFHTALAGRPLLRDELAAE